MDRPRLVPGLDLPELLTTDDLALRYRVPPRTVASWRYLGTGPAGTKIGGRVYYRASDVLRWEQEKSAAHPRHAGSE